MTGTIHVKGYERKAPEKRPDPFQAQIDARIAKRRAEADAYRRINKFRDDVGYKAGTRPIDVVLSIAGKLKRLAMTGRD